MKTKKRRRPELVRTDYAYRCRKTGAWWNGWCAPTSHPNNFCGKTFAEAETTKRRGDVDEKLVEVYSVRCRALSTRTKRSAKRTR